MNWEGNYERGKGEFGSIKSTHRPVQLAMSSRKWHKQLPFRGPSESRWLDHRRIRQHSPGASEALHCVWEGCAVYKKKGNIKLFSWRKFKLRHQNTQLGVVIHQDGFKENSSLMKYANFSYRLFDPSDRGLKWSASTDHYAGWGILKWIQKDNAKWMSMLKHFRTSFSYGRKNFTALEAPSTGRSRSVIIQEQSNEFHARGMRKGSV